MKMTKYFDMNCNANTANKYCSIIMSHVTTGQSNKAIDQHTPSTRRNTGGRWGDDRPWKLGATENIRDHWQ